MRGRWIAVAALVSAIVLWPAGGASAHPLGNFTVNRWNGLVVTPGEVRLDVVVDLAEIPTFQLLPDIDRDGDDVASPAELDDWAAREARRLGDALVLRIDGSPAELAVEAASAGLRPGQGGLHTLRLEAVLATEAPEHGELAFRDATFPGQIGWREVTAVGAEGTVLSATDVPDRSVSDRLLAYPEDLLASPLDVTEARLSFGPGASGPAPAPVAGASLGSTASPARPGVEVGGPFGDLLANRGLPLILLGLVVAIAFGAWHALLPGHGKTLMAAYMVGAGARTRQAVGAGVAVAMMHTTSVLALGASVLALQRTFRPEALYPWLGLVSGLAALILGCYLLWTRARAAVTHRRGASHGHAHPHAHAPAGGPAATAPLSRRGIAALAVAGGILPAPSALLVMLAAINAHRVAYGLALVLAFSVGLAGALILVGLGAVRMRAAVARRLSATAGRLVPVASAVAIVLVGTYLTVAAAGKV